MTQLQWFGIFLGVLTLILALTTAQGADFSWKPAPRKHSFAPVEAYCFPKRHPGRKGIRTDALLIARTDGQILFERYADGYGADRRHYAWSMSKSFTNALVGIAVKKGLLALDDPAWKWIPELERESHRGITLRHLLQFTPGLKANEGYEASPLFSTVLAMLYTRGRGDMGAFAAGAELVHEPGSYFEYSSGPANILMKVLQARLGTATYLSFPQIELFEPLGIQNAIWERDGSDVYVGSSYLHLTARDLARFGVAFLKKELWTQEWIDFSTALSPGFKESDGKAHPGAHWWVNRPLKGKQPWPAAPETVFAALGHWGQSLFLIPSRNLVVARFADDRDKTFNRNRFLELILK